MAHHETRRGRDIECVSCADKRPTMYHPLCESCRREFFALELSLIDRVRIAYRVLVHKHARTDDILRYRAQAELLRSKR